MTEIRFLSSEEVQKLNRNQIEVFGGSLGIRDLGTLLSALDMPRSGFGDQYFHKTIYEKAAAYFYHLILNHPFIDGNKRVGAITALMFLGMNGIIVKAPEDSLADLVLDVIAKKKGKPENADFFEMWAIEVG